MNNIGLVKVIVSYYGSNVMPYICPILPCHLCIYRHPLQNLVVVEGFAYGNKIYCRTASLWKRV